jgi:prepilin signal peptidase PulO-like enzyme (type II secretory pathway)
MVLLASIFGVAAYTQPAIGRFYLAGHAQLAQSLYYDAAQGTPMDAMAGIALLLFVSSFIVFGVAVARMPGLPKLAGIGFAVSAVLFAVIGFALDNWIQSVASALRIACSVWIVIALSRRQPESADQLRASLASAQAR